MTYLIFAAVWFAASVLFAVKFMSVAGSTGS